MDAKRLFYGCNQNVLWMQSEYFEACYQDVSWMQKDCFMDAKRLFHECNQNVLDIFYGCYRDVMFVLLIVIRCCCFTWFRRFFVVFLCDIWCYGGC